MAESDDPQPEPPTAQKARQKILKGLNLFSRWQQHQGEKYAQSATSHDTSPSQPPPAQRARSVVEGPTSTINSPHHDHSQLDEPLRRDERARTSRSVVPGLPRAQTFKRQLSEERSRLAPVEPSLEERRAVSMDRRSHLPLHVRNYGYIDSTLEDQNTFEPHDLEEVNHQSSHLATAGAEGQPTIDPNATQPDFFTGIGSGFHPSGYPADIEELDGQHFDDDRSIVSSVHRDEQGYAEMIAHELENSWILNLSMRYKDRSNREKFFVTYRQQEQYWRRVTVTLDYRDAPEDSLEAELRDSRSQREKSSKIYEAIRQSLQEIQFYETVTNLKLETTDNRLHVHVVEDVNEIIQYPLMHHLAHLGCRRVKESDIDFDYHMSGFVYKVHVDGVALIKKEIPGPETIDEFLYEINALNSLRYSDNVIKFYGLVVDDFDQVKGLLISYADGGALIDVIYDSYKDKTTGIRWSLKERWARQIVNGLADVHECGFVQGDFTLSNIVIDEHDNAKIIDINRRGCPVGWEPPEATPLIESQHRISMYIGVKSDLYQLGMVLWAIAMGEDEPEREGRPLQFDPNNNVPDWYRQITEICLSPDPRKRLQACMLLQLFPSQDPQITVEEDDQIHTLAVNEFHPYGHPQIRVEKLPHKFWSPERSYSPGTHPSNQPWHFAPRGRSPPSPMPSNYDESKSPNRFHSRSSWAANMNIRASYSDAGGDEVRLDDVGQEYTPNTSVDRGPLPDFEEREVDGKKEPRPMEFEVVEDAQVTPTQETVNIMVESEAKDAVYALQETSGNVAKPTNMDKSPDTASDEKDTMLEKLEGALVQGRDLDEGDVAKENLAKPADLVEEPQENATKPDISLGAEVTDEKHESNNEGTGEKTEASASAASAELPPMKECDTNSQEATEGDHDEQHDQASPEAKLSSEAVEDAITEDSPTVVEPAAEEVAADHETASKEDLSTPVLQDQGADPAPDDAEELAKTDNLPEKQQLQESLDSTPKPAATTEEMASKTESEALPTNTEEQAPQPVAESEQPPAHVDHGPLPTKDASTPRISPSLNEDDIQDPELLHHAQGKSASDDLVPEKDINDGFQLVDRPPQTAPAVTVTTDATT